MPSVTVPLPPSVNHCYVTTRQGRRVLTADARSWMDVASTLARAAARKASHRPCETWTRVIFQAYFPDRRRRDMDNLHKLTLDALKGIAYDDDCRALCHDRRPAIDKEHPRLVLTWEEEPCAAESAPSSCPAHATTTSVRYARQTPTVG